jgi:ADP-heptose:LPS heptosyltransferase
MRVLIIQTGGLGDWLFTTPLIQAMRKQFPGVTVSVVVSAATSERIQPGSFEAVFTFSSPASLLKRIAGKRYDWVIDLEGRWFSRLLASLVGARRLSPEMARTSNGKHIVDMFFQAVEPLKVIHEGYPIEFEIPFKDEVPMEWLPEPFRKGFVAFCIDAPFETRRLPLKRMIELCDKINKPVILLGSSGTSAIGESIERFFSRTEDGNAFEEGLRELNKKTIVFNGCGKFNLNQMASLVRQARHVFTFDNDFVAIASAFQKNIITIWGNTVPSAGRYPYNTRFLILENNKLSCRPCSPNGYSACPLKHFRCMNELVFDFYIP